MTAPRPIRHNGGMGKQRYSGVQYSRNGAYWQIWWLDNHGGRHTEGAGKIKGKGVTGKGYGYEDREGGRERAEEGKRWRAALAGGEVGPVDNGGQTGKLDDGDKK